MPPAETYRPVTPEVMEAALEAKCSLDTQQLVRTGAVLALVLAVDREIERGHLAEIAVDSSRLAFYLGQLCVVSSMLGHVDEQPVTKDELVNSLDIVVALAETHRHSLAEKMALVLQCPVNPEEVN